MNFGFSFGGTNQNKKPKSSDPLLQRLDKIRDSYTNDNPNYRFRATTYNPKPNSTSYSQKPNCVTQEEWDQISASSPLLPSYCEKKKDTGTLSTTQSLNMEPKILCGFNELDNRIQDQSSVIEKMISKLKFLQDRIADLRIEYSKNIKSRLKELTDKNNEINLELMKFMEKEEVKALQSHPFSMEENEIYDKLEELSQEIQKPNKFEFSLNTLKVNSKMMRENLEAIPQINVPDESIKSSQEILKVNSDALKALSKVIKQIYKSTDILSNQLNI